MKNKVRGGGLRLTGLILGIIATVCGVTCLSFPAIGLHQPPLSKPCGKGAEYR